MERNIENLIKRNADRIKYSRIKAAMQSKVGESLMWVLVEGVNDEMFYERMFDSGDVMIRTASNEQGDESGKTIVCDVVSKLHEGDGNGNVIGIVDRDYDEYCLSPRQLSENVFKTDYRDLEMTLFADNEVTDKFKEACCLTDETFCCCVQICRQMGYIRITAVVNGIVLGLKKIGNTCVWNRHCQKMEENWKQNLLEKINCQCIRKGLSTITLDDIECTERKYNLDKKHYTMICRGHDMLSLLSFVIGKTHCWDEKKIFIWLCEHIAIKNIRRMKLYADINQWQNDNQVFILK